MKKLISSLTKIILGLLILFGLFYYLGLENILNNFLKLNPLYVFIALTLLYVSIVGNVLNFVILTKALTKNIKVKNIIRYSLLSWSYGNFFPGKIGEFSLAYFFKKNNVPLSTGVVIVLIDKIISFIVLFFISSFGFLIFFELKTAVKIVSIFCIIFLMLIFFVFTKFGRNILKLTVLRWHNHHFKGFSKDLWLLLRNKKAIALDIIITFLRWVINFLVLYLLFIALSYNVSFLMLSIIHAISTISSFLPITLSGLGVRESVGVYLFLQLGVPGAVTGVAFLTFRVLMFAIAGIFISLLSWK